MPGPAVPLFIGGTLLLAWWLGKGKGGAPADNTGATDVVNFENPPPVDQPAVKGPTRYAYTLQSGDTPLGLAQAWTGKATSNELFALSNENPKLQRMEQTRVRYLTSGSDVSGQLNPTGVYSYATLPAGQPAGPVPTTPSTPTGQSYPNSPMAGSFGQWVEDGAHVPVLSPWNAGDSIAIPAAWGDPPASLAANAHAFLNS